MNIGPDQTDEREFVVSKAQTFVATSGCHILAMPIVARACGLETAGVRAQFADFPALLAEILRQQLRALTAAISAVPPGEPDLLRLRRAAYLTATRTPHGHTEAHTLLLRCCHLLPANDAEAIAQAHLALGVRLAGPLADQALALLDSLAFDAGRIEATLSHLGARRARLCRAMAKRRAAAAAMQPPRKLSLFRKPGRPHTAPLDTKPASEAFGL